MALLNYTGKNVFGVCSAEGEPVRLMPGINEVQDDVLEALKKYPTFMSRINKGIIIILGQSKEKDGKRPIEEMLDLIPKMFDLKLLKKIIDSDTRDLVVRAAKEQLEKIKNPAKAKAEASADEHFS